MNDMSQTTVNLGYVPKNRGEYSSTASYYKDNIVQYNGSSYICNPPNYDPDTAPTASITGVAPYASDPAVPNTGWAVFSNDSSGVGEGVYDVSVGHTTDNQPKKYADLSAALQDVPQAKQKGGMTIRFIQSYDNKYVQYRLMSDTFNTTVANWQGVDDEPVALSKNAVTSGGVAKSYFANVIDVKGRNVVDFEIKTGAEHSVFDGITLKKNTEYKIVSSIGTAKSSTVYIAIRYTDNGTSKTLAVLNIAAGNLTSSVSVVPPKDLQNCRIDVYCSSYVESASVAISIVDFELKGEDSIGVLKIDHNHYFANGYINTDGSIAGQTDGISIYKDSYIKTIPNGRYKIDNPFELKTGYATYDSNKTFLRAVWFNTTDKVVLQSNEHFIRLMLRRAAADGGLTSDIFKQQKMLIYLSLDPDKDINEYLKELNFRNTSGNNVVWSDGSAGVINTTLNSVTGEINSFYVTHVNSGLRVRQPAVTRDSNYFVTNIPNLVVENI